MRRRIGYRNLLLENILGRREFGLDQLDSKVARILNIRNGFYIELGANDGVSQSNTLALELFSGWRGILIEPIKESFDQLKTNRSSKRNCLVRAACVADSTRRPYIDIVKSGLRSTPILPDSDIRDPFFHATDSPVHDKSSIERVPTSTLEEVISNCNAPHRIDLLSLDVEGGELEVLKGINFGKVKISAILLESRDVERIRQYLAPRGYGLHRTLSKHDYLFLLSGDEVRSTL